MDYKVGDKVRFETRTKVSKSSIKDDWKSQELTSTKVHRGTVIRDLDGIKIRSDGGKTFPEYLAHNIQVIYRP